MKNIITFLAPSIILFSVNVHAQLNYASGGSDEIEATVIAKPTASRIVVQMSNGTMGLFWDERYVAVTRYEPGYPQVGVRYLFAYDCFKFEEPAHKCSSGRLYGFWRR